MDLYTQDGQRPAELTTARLSLRPVAATDAKQIVEGINNLAVSRWLAVVPYPYLLSDALWFVEENLAGRIASRSIWRDDVLIGNIDCDTDLGYWLAEPFWGQGYATEAAQAVLSHAFTSSGISKLGSGYFVGNRGSANVLRKLGFKNTRVERVYSVALQREIPSQRVQLTRDAWEARHG